MKPKPIYRIFFALIVAVGSLFMLNAAKNISSQNLVKRSNICEVDAPQQFAPSNNEFIFFESVTKYLVFSLVK